MSSCCYYCSGSWRDVVWSGVYWELGAWVDQIPSFRQHLTIHPPALPLVATTIALESVDPWWCHLCNYPDKYLGESGSTPHPTSDGTWQGAMFIKHSSNTIIDNCKNQQRNDHPSKLNWQLTAIYSYSYYIGTKYWGGWENYMSKQWSGYYFASWPRVLYIWCP